MAITNLGAVGISAGGVYNSETVYKKYKVVSASGGSYMYINPTPAAGVPVTNTSHWQQIAAVGGQDLVDAAVAARDAAEGYKDAAAASAAQLAAGTASPAGTYANLAALIAANPDHTKTYITLNDGKWCYWNGSAWVAGGVYQATAIADGQVTPEKLSDSVGLYKTVHPKIVKGHVKSDTGGLQDSTTNLRSYEFLPYNYGDTLVFTGGTTTGQLGIRYYDMDKNYLGTSASYSRHVTDRLLKSESDGYIKLVLQDSRFSLGELPEEVFQELSTAVYLITNQLKALTQEQKKAPKTTNVPLEAHGINKTTGTIISNKELSATDNFTTMQRTGKYLRVTPSSEVTLSFSNGKAYVFEYDDSFVFLGYTELNNNIGHELRPDTTLVKVSLEELTVNHPNVVIKYTSNTGDDKWVYNDNRTNRPNTDWEYASFIYETQVNEGRSILNPNGTEEQRSSTRYFNSGILMLPSNYDPQGDPVRLIIWCQGSGGFLSFSSGIIDNYNQQFKYLLDEGYAMFGAYRKTTKYGGSSLDSSNVYAMPTTISALISGYKHVIQNYNIAKDGVFVSGKSSGGFDANMISYHPSIPVLATGLLAPTFEPLNTPYGSHEDARLIVADDFGFVGNHSVLADQGHTPVPVRTPELKQYMVDNAEKMIGYNPWWNGLIGEDVEQLASDSFEGVNFDYERNKNKLRLFPNPIKIWYAEDDDRANIPLQIPLFAKQIQNTQGNIEIRKMPIGTGGHGSVDTHPDSIKLPSVTAELGVTHSNVPLAYVELVSYFRRFGN